ncbi:hypothetical protein HGRIS_014358 [Hohenbuehelia grisea]|uniref:Uncharacterized protein n=1 Tax=Hohenbuehelia grisea TaxID=104357 RepID=A0ABR3JTA8_9AGAR
MLLKSVLAGLVCATVHSALVNAYVVPRQTFSQADSDGMDDLPYNFTLAAWNTTLPNTNSTGAPLVLGQNGATSGFSLQVTSTWASYPYNEYPVLSLIGGTLRAYTRQGEWITNATSVFAGRPMGWVTTRMRTTAVAAKDFAVTPLQSGTVPQPSPAPGPGASVPAETEPELPLLYGLGTADLWSLCPTGSGPFAQTNVVFNASASPPWAGYNPADCFSVRLHIVRV